MNEQNLKLIFFTSVAIGFTIVTIKHGMKTHTEEKAKRAQIEADMHLDIAAINRAAAVVNERIERGEICNYDQLRDAVTTEIAFNKIAIREE